MDRLTIAFLGQCQTVGYPGVPPDAVFPQICRRAVQAQRPEVRIEVDVVNYYHPLELPEKTAAALRRSPRVVVIEAIGWMTVRGKEALDLSRLPRGVKTAVQRVRHLRTVASRMTLQLPGGARLHTAQHDAMAWSGRLLGDLVPRYARPTIDGYAQGLESALALLRAAKIDAVVQGPAAPAFALDARSMAPDVMERYRAVEQLARRAAELYGALYVDRWDTVSRDFFLPGDVRPTARGHMLWGHLLAEKLLGAGIV